MNWLRELARTTQDANRRAAGAGSVAPVPRAPTACPERSAVMLGRTLEDLRQELRAVAKKCLNSWIRGLGDEMREVSPGYTGPSKRSSHGRSDPRQEPDAGNPLVRCRN